MLLGCCEEAISFLTQIGSIDQVDFLDRITLIGNAGERFYIQSSILPAPLHLLPSVLRMSGLSLMEKMALCRVLAAVMLRAPVKGQTAGDYMRSLFCPSRLLDRLIEPVIISALNEGIEDTSAEYARMVLLESLTRSKSGYRLGVPRTTNAELIEKPASDYLRKRGCEVRISSKVTEIDILGNRACKIGSISGEMIDVDYCVCAVPSYSLMDMGIDPQGGESLDWHPIVSAHLFFEGDTGSFEPVCVMGEPFQWVFNISGKSGYIQAVASAADGIVSLSNNDLIDLALGAVEKVEPALDRNKLKRGVVLRSRRATFGTNTCDACRPSPETPLSNLFLAGDWTDTHWPATIESAVRSGRAAARAVMGCL